MTSKEFIKEVKSSNICPENFDTVYCKFQEYQSMLIGALNEFHRICKKNEIHYQLAFGSLLGAIRDNGQIPWDYDIDVLVPYNERTELLVALKQDLDKHYYFDGAEINPRCHHSALRIAPVGFDSSKFHLDIFFLIGSYDDDTQRLNHEKEVRKYFHIRYLKVSRVKADSIKKTIGNIAKKLSIVFLSLNEINRRIDKICSEVSIDQSNICIPMIYGAYSGIYFYTKKALDLTDYTNDKGTFLISKSYEAILTTIYKDYKKIYPLENRLNEMYSLYQKISGEKFEVKVLKGVKGGRYYSN